MTGIAFIWKKETKNQKEGEKISHTYRFTTEKNVLKINAVYMQRCDIIT